jgi:hypothetical protein
MARAIAWEGIREAGVLLPPGLIKFKIEDMTEEVSQNTGKAMIVAHLRAVEPKQVRNLSTTEYFVIGTDDDPNCDDPATYGKTVGASRFKTLIKKANVRQAPTLEKTAKLAEGQEFIAAVTQEVEKDGKYAGRIRNRIAAFFAIGERKPGVDASIATGDGETTTPAKSVVASAKKVTPPPADDDEDEDEEEEEEE